MALDFVSRAAWGAKPPRSSTPWRTGQPSEIVVHWIGSYFTPTPSLDQGKTLMRNLQNAAFGEGYADIEYNFMVDGLGRVYEGRGYNVESGANGAGTKHNQWGLAVCYAGGPKAGGVVTPLTAAAKMALVDLTREVKRRFGTVATVWGHNEVRLEPTACPGLECQAFTAEMERALTDAPPPDDDEDDMPETRCFLAKTAESATVYVCARTTMTRTKMKHWSNRQALAYAGIIDPAVPVVVLTAEQLSEWELVG